MDIVLFGIQGSGKGTQAKKLASEYGYAIFEAGAELRKIASSGTFLGNTVKSFIDNGNLVPHEIIMQVVKEAVLRIPREQKILFDGVARDLNQKKDFDAIMQEVGREFRAIYFALDLETAMARVKERGKIEGRADDSDEEKIRRRMAWTVEKTMPVVEAYRQEGKVKHIEADRSIDAVYEEVKKVVETWNTVAA
jgi:adenylate kinase